MPESVHAAPTKAPESVPARSDDQVSRLALQLVAANARLSALAIVTAVALIVLGAWVYSGVQQSLREMRSAGLQTLLAAEVEALAVWIDDRRVSASHWAGEAAIRRNVLELLQLVRAGHTGGDALWNAPARTRLDEALQPALKQMGAVAFNVV